MSERIHIEEPWRAALSAIGLSTLKHFMRDAAGMPVGATADGDVLRLRLEVNGASRELYLKRTRRHRRRYLLGRLRGGRWAAGKPVDAFRNALRLAEAGLPAARAVGYGMRKRGLLPHEGFVLLEPVQGRRTLYQHLENGAASSADWASRRQLLCELGTLIHRLHEHRLRWGDASAEHLLVSDDPAQDTHAPRLHMISLTNVQASGSSASRRRDLIRLVKSLPLEKMSRTDLVRIGHAYCGVAGMDRRQRRARLAERIGWAGRILQRLSQARGEGQAGGGARYIRVRGVTLDDRYITVFRDQGFKSFESVFDLEPVDHHWHQQMEMEVIGTDGAPIRLRLHRFRRPPWREQWRRIRSGKPKKGSAWRLWQRALADAKHDPAAGKPVAFGEKMRGWFELRGFVLLQQPSGDAARAETIGRITPAPSSRR